MRLSQEDVDPLAHSSSSSDNSNSINNVVSCSGGGGSNGHGDKSLPLNMAAYEYLDQAGVDVLELSDTDSSARSTAQFQEKLNDTAAAAAAAASEEEEQPQRHKQTRRPQQQQQRHEPGTDAESGLARGTANISMHQARSEGGAKEGESAYPGAPPPGQFPPPPVKRQGAMSDLWQQQGAYRSNGKSMKSIFQEVSPGMTA